MGRSQANEKPCMFDQVVPASRTASVGTAVVPVVMPSPLTSPRIGTLFVPSPPTTPRSQSGTPRSRAARIELCQLVQQELTLERESRAKVREKELHRILVAEAAKRRDGNSSEEGVTHLPSLLHDERQAIDADPRIQSVRQKLAEIRKRLGCSTEAEILAEEAAAVNEEFRHRAKLLADREKSDRQVAETEARRLRPRHEPTTEPPTPRALAFGSTPGSHTASWSHPEHDEDIAKLRATAAAARKALDVRIARGSFPPPAAEKRSPRPMSSSRGLTPKEQAGGEVDRLARLTQVKPQLWEDWRMSRMDGKRARGAAARARRVVELEEQARVAKAVAERARYDAIIAAAA